MKQQSQVEIVQQVNTVSSAGVNGVTVLRGPVTTRLSLRYSRTGS